MCQLRLCGSSDEEENKINTNTCPSEAYICRGWQVCCKGLDSNTYFRLLESYQSDHNT